MLGRLAHQIVQRRKEVVLIAFLLAALGVFGMMNQRINYDILSYLPRELSSVQGIDILNEKFGIGTTLQVLVEGLTDNEVEALKERVEAVKGVEKVSWVTDFADVTIPREFWQKELIENYYSGNSTLLQVSFAGSPQAPETKEAFLKVRKVFDGKKAYLVGSLAEAQDLEGMMSDERVKYTTAALVLVSLVLVLTIPSIIVPLLFVMTIGLAVVYNLGLSFYLNQELSYLTGVVVFSLQFSVTMDYALFLYHRFEEEREELPDEKAMEKAILTTFKAVSSAALTTMAGFIALAAMKLGFGTDMGLTLARGVFITLIAVLTVLPSLLLIFDPLIQKIAHRSFLPDFVRTAKFVTKHAFVFLLVFFLLFVPALYGYANVEKNFNLHEGIPKDLPSVKGSDVLAEKFGRKEKVFYVFKDYHSLTQLEQVMKKVEKVDGVEGTFGYTKLVDPLIPLEFIPEKTKGSFFKDDYTYYSIDLKYGENDVKTPQTLKNLKKATDSFAGASYLTGSAVLLNDLEKVTNEDVDRVNYLSVLAIFFIVFFVFRSITIPIVLVTAIELAILLNQGISAFLGSEVVFIAALAIGAIQLGATVDYAILLTSRYEEELRRLKNRWEAIRKAVQESAQPILVSAGTMFGATIGMALISKIGMIKGLATLISRGAIVSFLVVVLFLPALLVLGQPLFEKTSLGWPKEPKNKGG